jgi:uncharacterized phiE125 gp8 family phage protein
MSFIYASDLAYLDWYQQNIEYVLNTPAAARVLTLTEVKMHLRINTAVTAEDDYLTALIDAITSYAEEYTRRDLISKTYYAFMDRFPPDYFSFNARDRGQIIILRSKLQSVSAIQYYQDGAYVTVSSSDYYITNSPDFGGIYLVSGSNWPTDLDERKQAVRITFVAGYGATAASVPTDLKYAILQHLASYYVNRGDCMDCSTNIPALAQKVYDKYKIPMM